MFERFIGIILGVLFGLLLASIDNRIKRNRRQRNAAANNIIDKALKSGKIQGVTKVDEL